MKVVLTKDVPNLGTKGQVQTVKVGYFQNYLEPRGLAERLTRNLETKLRAQEAQAEKKRQEKLEKAEEFKAEIEAITLSFEKEVTESGKLYAAVTHKQAQEQLEKLLKISLEKGSVQMETIKEPGEAVATVKLNHETTANVKVVVSAKDSE